MPAKKKHGVAWWKDKVWTEFSKYIRLRDRIEENGFPTEYAACVTCGKVAPWRELQAGHFVAGRRNSILFDERNCHAQCYGCNCGRSGHVIEYYPYMLEHYGQDVIDELKWKHDNEQKKFDVEELKQMKKHYQKKIERLMKL